MDRKEYRTIIRHAYLLGKKAIEIDKELQEIYGDAKPSYSTIKSWVAAFKTGHMSIDDESRSGRPESALTPNDIEKIDQLVTGDRKIGIETIAATMGISYGTDYNVVTDKLGYKKLEAKWVPKDLSAVQKRAREQSCRDFLLRWDAKWSELKCRIITSDETWIRYETPDTKNSSKEWRRSGEGRPEMERAQVCGGQKVMLTIFGGKKGVILTDYFTQSADQGLNGEYYANLIDQLADEIKMLPNGHRHDRRLLLIDNAKVHWAALVSQALERAGLQRLDHPPYSPDIAPSDFYLFRNLKNWLRGKKFASFRELREEVESWFRHKPESFYERAFDELRDRMKSVVRSRGEYL